MTLELAHRRVLVLGLGETGLSAVRWLARRGAVVRVADSREAPPHAADLARDFPGVILDTGPFRAASFAEAELVVASPGVPLAEPQVQAALERGIPVVGDVELFALTLRTLAAPPRVLAITGSNGKSTVTRMAEALCRAAGARALAAGNIGLPVLDVLDGEERPEVVVLELSSFQLETTASLDAVAATVLNLSEDHMDRYAGMADYAAAKARVFQGGGLMVLNRDDPLSLALAQPGRAVVTFGLDAPGGERDYGLRSVDGEAWLACGTENLMPVRELPLAGLHNAANALAALALCRALGYEWAPLLEGLRRFKGLPHRVEKVGEVNGVTFYDDSKGTNVGATEAALKGMTCPVVLIAGGDGKGQDFGPLGPAVAGKARAVVLIGRDADLIEAAVAGRDVPILREVTLEAAVKTAFQTARPGDAVLLSPACASWDMFRNYVHRAEVFITAVRGLEREAAHA